MRFVRYINEAADDKYALIILRAHGTSDSPPVCLPGSNRFQVDVRLVCVVGLCKLQRSTADTGVHLSQRA